MASRLWWTGWCSRRSHKSWNRSSIRASRHRASGSARARRSAHDALRQARGYVAEGQEIVVDLDLEKFYEGGSQVSPSISACRRIASAPFGTGYDRVNHDILMARLARRIGDKRLLRIVHRFLQAGMMQDGVCIERQEGTPQGGPLSPMLANLLLDDLDKELERRGHWFCRYADDCNIYVRSQAAGERVMASVTAFLEGRLKLRVNRQKSAVAWVGERQFLGHRLGKEGSLGIGRKSLDRAKDKLRAITRRNRGIPVERMAEAANRFLVGWVTYFRHTRGQSMLRELDGWLRRKLRCVRLKPCKRPSSVAAFLERGGVEQGAARRVASSGKGWWRLTATEQARRAMSKDWFEAIGLVSAAKHHAALNAVGNRRGTRSVRPVV